VPDVPSFVGEEDAGRPVNGATLLHGPELDAACARFLFQEAYLLDHRRYTDWLALLTPDIEYAIPLRSVTIDGLDEYSAHSYYMNETFDSIEARIARFATDYAWAEEPPSKARHCVSNVFIEDASAADVRVRSNLVLLRYTTGQATPVIVSAERIDRLRQTAHGLKLSRRDAYVDSSVLGMHNFTVFL
jgi:3-phenylpropionate/cinnamic acid dioxygenase small subunit